MEQGRRERRLTRPPNKLKSTELCQAVNHGRGILERTPVPLRTLVALRVDECHHSVHGWDDFLFPNPSEPVCTMTRAARPGSSRKARTIEAIA